MASYVGTQQEMTAPDIGITMAPTLTDSENENKDTENVEEDNAADLEYMKGYLTGDVLRYDALNNHYVAYKWHTSHCTLDMQLPWC
jgi:hypothetical protein